MTERNLTGPAIGRRRFVQVGALTLLGLSLNGVAGCAPAPRSQLSDTSSAYVPGTYEAKAMGKKSIVTVRATFTDSELVDIEVDHHDTERIAEAAIATTVPEIIDYQTLDVDAVSGATLTTMAITTALKECIEEAGGSVSTFETPREREVKTAEEEIEADLVILGAGGSGLPAGIIAAQHGARVVIFEKNGFFGGSLMVSGGSLEYLNAPLDMRPETTEANRTYFAESLRRGQELGIDQGFLDTIQKEWDDWYAAGNTKVYDSMNWYALCMCLGSESTDYTAQLEHGSTNEPLISWLTDEVGLQFKKPTVGLAGYPWPEASSIEGAAMGEGYVDGFDAYIEKNNLAMLDILLSTPAEELLVENGAVVGAKGTCADGTTYTVKATKGVIIATGGYAGNKELLEEFAPSFGFDALESVPTVNPAGHDGDGITMARAVGAAAYVSDYHMFCPCANAKILTADSYVGDTTNMLLVNQEGKRYVDETLDRNMIAAAVMEQPDQRGYIIASSENAMIDEDGRNAFGDPVEPMLEAELVYKADTLEELAGILGIDASALTATVEQFNQSCETGEDPDFGRVTFAETAALKSGPYYGTPITWATLICDGGLTTGENDEVLDEAGEPIPGLYAIGEVCSQSGIAAMGYGVRIANRMFA